MNSRERPEPLLERIWVLKSTEEQRDNGERIMKRERRKEGQGGKEGRREGRGNSSLSL